MQKNKKFYDDFFNKYPVGVHDNSARFEAVCGLLSGSVLDVACGTGTLAKYYAGDYVGVDLSDVAIRKALAVRRKDAKFLCADIEKTKLTGDKKFDSVYLGEFLEHIENDVAVFEKIKEVLAPNGRIIISVPNGDRVPDESHCRLFSVPQIRRDYAKYGKITFHKWSGFSQRLLFSIEPNKKNSDDISLVMMCKNEAKGLETAILSCIDFVDSIHIAVDTASNDKTKEIATLYADEVRDLVWRDDFSYGRNFAQENVKTKWCLFLDGHEYVKNKANILKYLDRDVDGILVTVELENKMTFMFPRVYRSHIKFTGKTHNLNKCPRRLSLPNFRIVHDRLNLQDGEAVKIRNVQREKMLPQDMKGRIKKDKKDLRALFHLGNYHLMRKQYKPAVKIYKQYLKYSKSKEENYLMALNCGICYQMLGHYFRSLLMFDKADKFLPGRWETARLIGGSYLAMGFYKKANEWLVQAFNDNERKFMYEPFPKDEMQIWDMIGTCFHKSNQYEKAVIAWKRARELADDDKHKKFFVQKVKLAEMLVKK